MNRRPAGLRANRGRISSGFAAAFPLSLGSSLIWYLDARYGITTATGVSAWADQSGQNDSGRNALQGTGANQPAYNTSDASWNNQPTVGPFSTSTTRLTTGTWSATYSPAFTIVILANVLDEAANRYVYSSNITQRLDALSAAATKSQSVGGNPDGSATLITGGVSILNPSMIMTEHNGASSKQFVNSLTAAVTGSLFTTSLGLTAMNVGSWRASINSGGKMAAIFAVNRLMTAGEKAQLQAFAAIWGITVGP